MQSLIFIPLNGSTVRSANITVTGSGGADAKEGDRGQVVATLNGQTIFQYAGSFRYADIFSAAQGRRCYPAAGK